MRLTPRLDYHTVQEQGTVKAALAFILALTVPCSCATYRSKFFHLVSKKRNRANIYLTHTRSQLIIHHHLQ